MAAGTTTGHRVVWLVTNGLETNDIQGDVWFLGTDRHKLKKEFSVVSDQMNQQMLREIIRVEHT